MSYGAVAAAIGGNILTTYMNNMLARQREADARQENFYYNERAANAADKRTRALYQDLQSPQAMMNQLKDAGLSPSLMYGGEMGGTVGQGAQGSGASGISPSIYGASALEAAQIGLIQAQTAKTHEETVNISTNTDKQKAEIDKIVEETKNEQLKQVWNELNNTLTQMDLNIKGNYAEIQIEAEIAKVQAEANNLSAQLRYLKAQGKITEESADAIIKYNRGKVIEQAANVFLKEQQAKLAQANITLTNTQVEKLLNDILVSNQIVDVSKRKVTIDENKLNEQVKQWGIENDLHNKEINVKLASEIGQYLNKKGENFVRAIDALIPF